MVSYTEPEHHPWQQPQSPHKASQNIMEALYCEHVRLLKLAEEVTIVVWVVVSCCCDE